MKSSMTSIRVIYVHREREKVDFKSRAVNCLKECAQALSVIHVIRVLEVIESVSSAIMSIRFQLSPYSKQETRN